MTPSPWIVLATTDNVTIGYKGPLDASCVDTAHGAPHRNQLAPIRVLETEWEVKHGATVTVVLVSPVPWKPDKICKERKYTSNPSF